jgi:hypothetical protein
VDPDQQQNVIDPEHWLELRNSCGVFVFREIEVKVMSYQDDLENGEKGIKAGWSIQDQVPA